MIRIFDKHGNIKTSANGGGGGVAIWGGITGTLSDQTDLQAELNLKAPKNNPVFTGTVSGITKAMVGLGNVDNTSDATKNAAVVTLTNKSISATNNTITGLSNTNLNGSAGISDANISSSAYWNAKQDALTPGVDYLTPTGDGSGLTGLTKAQVGLSDVDNTSDADKPISTATQTALDGKVDENASILGATATKITYDSKGLVTGSSNATTADINDSTNRRYVTDAQLIVIGNTSGTNSGDNAVNTLYSGLAASKADIASPTFTGIVTSPSYVMSGATPNTIAVFGAFSELKSAPTGSFPDLTELAYLKGVTSPIQTQLNATQPGLSGTGLVKSTAGVISYITDNSTNWNTAYTNRITTLTTTGNSGAATLIANTLNIPTYTAAGLGAVTNVTGTTNRITSTGGATPVIDISATFEALLSKIANRIDQNNAATTSAQLASVISDETGTNKLVFSDNPTLLSPVLTGVTSPTYAQGKLVYDTDNEALTFYNNESTVSLQIGQEFWIRVKNSTGSSISNGLAVYINGNDAGTGLPTIALAQANSSATALAVGLTTQTIANGAIGYVTSAGVVRGLDTSAYTDGVILYVSSSSAGGLTATAPSYPNFASRIGIVTKAAAGTAGTISVIAPTRALGLGTANQILAVNSAGTAQEYRTVSIKDVADSAAVTGTLTETIVTSLSVPAGMFAQGDIMKVSSFEQKLLSAGTLQIKYYVNTVNSLSGATAIFLYSSAATLKTIGTSREFYLKPSTIVYGHSATANNVIITESGTANAPLSATFNYVNAFFIIKTFVLGNTGDSAIGKSFRVEKI